ncbi:MAG TPA: sigma-70 family RNA polymerase sigma factor [Candidatus Angelobacter sp.]|jgi:RNA polymerase sigma-70 factor (ECF subfamily)|nr:sigma-70 family RNA polymerase sigma factor [Candidatus Angelobacter sp.]
MAEPARNELELLRQLAKGSDEAFRALYDCYQGSIYRFALHMSGNRSTAEEVTQEVFMQLISNFKGYDPAKGPLAAYLFGMARNLTRRTMRQLPREEELIENDSMETASDLDLLEELSQSDLLEHLKKAVLALPEPYREVVILCDLEEMSYPAAAELLQCSSGTVASRLHRARTMLKTKFSTKMKSEGCAR